MKYKLGPREFESESKYLTLTLRVSNDIQHDPEALRERLKSDGYLFLRGLHDREAVLEARREILSRLATRGALDPMAPLMEGVIRPDYAEPATSSVRGNEDLKTESLRAVVYGRRVMDFFARLFGAPVVSSQFQWLRAAGTEAASPIHCDAPYMLRGSNRLLSCWTPLGDVPPEMGPLVICLGSHRWQKVINTYGCSDVDRDLTTGAFTNDPAELVDDFGGRWATTHFLAGDVVVFGMHTIHASLTNMTNRLRISCDTRYQPAADPLDERWAGDHPQGHDRFWDPAVKLEPVEVSRGKWGV